MGKQHLQQDSQEQEDKKVDENGWPAPTPLQNSDVSACSSVPACAITKRRTTRMLLPLPKSETCTQEYLSECMVAVFGAGETDDRSRAVKYMRGIQAKRIAYFGSDETLEF